MFSEGPPGDAFPGVLSQRCAPRASSGLGLQSRPFGAGKQRISELNSLHRDTQDECESSREIVEKARPCQATEIRPGKRQLCEPGSERPAVAALPSAASCAGTESPLLLTPGRHHRHPLGQSSVWVFRASPPCSSSNGGVPSRRGGDRWETGVRWALLASGVRWGLSTPWGRGGGREGLPRPAAANEV